MNILDTGVACNLSSTTGQPAYVATIKDIIIHVDTSAAGNHDVNLPTPATSGMRVGQLYILKDATGNAGANNVRAVPPGAITIDGANAPKSISANFGALRLYTDGTNYFTW